MAENMTSLKIYQQKTKKNWKEIIDEEYEKQQLDKTKKSARNPSKYA